MRIIHRYLGFFLAGIMAVYSLSGIILIFRDTPFLKQEKKIEKTIATNLSGDDLGKALHLKKFKPNREEGNVIFFKEGTYNKNTGVADYTTSSQPFLIEKMNHLHKAQSGDPIFILNVFFGVSLFFFVISKAVGRVGYCVLFSVVLGDSQGATHGPTFSRSNKFSKLISKREAGSAERVTIKIKKTSTS